MWIELQLVYTQGGQAVIETREYTTLASTDYAPEVDVTGDTQPVNEVNVQIVTDDDLSAAQWGALYDDMDQLWFSGDVTFAKRTDPQRFAVRLSSLTYYLEYINLPAVMYNDTSAQTAIAACFADVSGSWSIDPAISALTVTGFCPEQTARERLTWLCFVLGAVVVTAFRSGLHIQPVTMQEKLIPLERTYMRPEMQYGDWVTGIRVTAYTFTEAQSVDEWKNDDSSYRFPMPWVARETVYSLSNPDAPSTAPENVVEISELYLINTANAMTLLTQLSQYWFNRVDVRLSCINNREFYPGDRVMAYTDPENMVTGYIRSAAFAFGKQAKAELVITLPVERETGVLTVVYRYNSAVLQRTRYRLPVGYVFTLGNVYPDITKGGVRTIYRPLTAQTSVTIQSGSHTVYVDCDKALILEDGVLTIISVDSVDDDGAGTVIIG